MRISDWSSDVCSSDLSAAAVRATICFATIRAGRGPCFCGNGSASTGPCGEIGRRAALKMRFRKECWFESGQGHHRSEEHTSEIQSLMRISYAVFFLTTKNITTNLKAQNITINYHI